jgi:glycosyltransferase involved in cell wall biosynthesis
MRIAFLGIRGVPARYGGFETFAEQLGKRLVARGHAVTVYGRSGWVPRRMASYSGMRIIRLPAPRSKYLETVVHSLFAAADAAFRRYDVVYVCNSANIPAVMLLMVARKTVVLNVDGLEWQRAKWNSLGKAYYRLCAAVAARLPIHVVTDARVIQEHYRAAYGRETEYFPYGTELERVPDDAEVRRHGLEPGEYVLYVSRLEPENNAHVVIEAFRGVRTTRILAVVGDAPYASDYIAGLKATTDDRVRFLGGVYGRGYRALQSGAAAYVQATEVGGTHPALVEAMGFGNAIVANDVPEHREVLGDTGLFYRQPDELAACLQSVLDDSSLADSLRKRARQRAESRFHWDRVTDSYETWLKSLIRRSVRADARQGRRSRSGPS